MQYIQTADVLVNANKITSGTFRSQLLTELSRPSSPHFSSSRSYWTSHCIPR